MTLKRCSNCGKEINSQANNCPFCGHLAHQHQTNESSIKCSFCGVLNNSNSRFCETCGAPIEARDTSNTQNPHPPAYQPPLQRQPEPSEVLRDKFYKKNWFSVLMLILFYPVGLIFMWKYKAFNKVVRIIISVFILLMFIGTM